MKSVRYEPRSAGMLMARCRASEGVMGRVLERLGEFEDVGVGTVRCCQKRPTAANRHALHLPVLSLRTCSIQAPLSPGKQRLSAPGCYHHQRF